MSAWGDLFASPGIRWRQLACPCGECAGLPEDPETRRTLGATAVWAEEIQAALGGWPLLIVAGWQCRSYNAFQAETDGEAHLLGYALDIVVRQLSPATIQKILVARHPGLIRGLGSYRGYTHVDRRDGEPRRWRE